MKEIFKDVVGFFGHYQVSSLGKVYSVKKFGRRKPVEMQQSTNANGYKCVTLSKDGKTKTVRVHRLVMETFCGYDKREVDHINRDKSDNRLCNLRYLTRKENMQNIAKNKKRKLKRIQDI